MYLFFDRVEEKIINGTVEVFAVNELDDQAYLLRNVTINTSESTLDESTLERFVLSISCHPETYVYRGSFNSASEMKEFSDRVLRLINEADKTNHAMKS